MMKSAFPQPMTVSRRGPLRGSPALPGDKSITHRALMLAAMARGTSRIDNPLAGEDVHSTADALRALGVGIEADGGGWTVAGVGTGGLRHPVHALDMGNSGTSTRLLMGLLSSHPVIAAFTGDASLCRRPMDRVIEPLRRVGAEIAASPGGRLPLLLRGRAPGLALSHRVEVASAQVKSALLLAGLNATGLTEVSERVATRDHTERMLGRFGADIKVEAEAGGSRTVRLRGEAELRPQQVQVPGDFSAAAFLIVAALVVPGSELRLERVGVNPMRTGLLRVLQEMGADITVSDEADLGGESVATLTVRHSLLYGVDVPPEIAPAMIDEFPALFVAAAFASGVTRAAGLGELRIKESDRIAAMSKGLRAVGVPVEESEDGLALRGTRGDPLPGDASITTELDHRIAMSFAVAGLHAAAPVAIDDLSVAGTSFPAFTETLARLTGG